MGEEEAFEFRRSTFETFRNLSRVPTPSYLLLSPRILCKVSENDSVPCYIETDILRLFKTPNLAFERLDQRQLLSHPKLLTLLSVSPNYETGQLLAVFELFPIPLLVTPPKIKDLSKVLRDAAEAEIYLWNNGFLIQEIFPEYLVTLSSGEQKLYYVCDNIDWQERQRSRLQNCEDVYLSPERFEVVAGKSEKFDEEKSQVFELGLTIFGLLNDGLDDMLYDLEEKKIESKAFSKIEEKLKTMASKESGTPNAVLELILKMLEFNPMRRPTLAEIFALASK